MLDTQAQQKLDTRSARGEKLMRVVWGARENVEGEDRYSAAKDAVSDVLTALLGPAGTSSYGGALSYDEERISEAHDVLYAALESYRGDAEDYFRRPEPGEYGHEEDAD